VQSAAISSFAPSKNGACVGTSLIWQGHCASRETALADVINLQLLEKREGENIVEMKKAENGYYVTFKVIHKEETLMELTVYAADFEQAETIKHNFLKNPSHVYSTVITSLFV
jgi:hypothetical protein